MRRRSRNSNTPRTGTTNKPNRTNKYRNNQNNTRPSRDTPLSIVVTYAPHQGYTEQERQERWGKVQQTIGQIPKRHMSLWGADTNGELGRDADRPEKYLKSIGPLTIHDKPEKGNGSRLAKICKKTHTHMIPTITWQGDKLTKTK